VRAPDDYGATYLADASLLDLFERARGEMPDWFADQVDRIARPDLPAFDPGAALAGIPDATPSPRRDVSADASPRNPSRTESRSRDAPGRTANRSSTGGSADGSTASRRDRDHPLSDVWGE
jgi:hypothetical protein